MKWLGFLRTRALHLVMTLFWLVMIIPTLLWWKDSILWVALMSVYACMTTHWSSYQGARAEHQADQGGPGPPPS